jgi:hypothetical protein
MANLTKARGTVALSEVMYEPELGPYGALASTIYYPGLMKTLDANGRPRDPGNVGDVVVGVVKDLVENVVPNSTGDANAGNNDSKWVSFLTGIFSFDPHAVNPPTQADVRNFAPVYASDNHTISRSAGDGSAAGIVVLVETGKVWVAVGPQYSSKAVDQGFFGAGLTPATNGIVAHAGGGQALAVPLTSDVNRIVTVVTAGDSVLLPAAAPGMQVTVINAAAANAANVFPAVGDTINALAANAAFSLVAGKVATFYCAVAGFWNAVLSA